MEYEVIVSRGALRDLEQIRVCIARDNPHHAQSFCQHLLDQSRRLSTSPYQGAKLENTEDGRFLVVKSYLLVYRVLEKSRTVRVLRYWHGSRNREALNPGG